MLKNTRLLRCAHHSSLRRTKKYASFLKISRALHLCIFEQPAKQGVFQHPAIRAGHMGDAPLYLIRTYTGHCRRRCISGGKDIYAIFNSYLL